MRTNLAVPLLSIALVAGACGGGETTTKATPDTVTLVVNGASTTWSDTAAGVSILAFSGSGGTNVELNATGVYAQIALAGTPSGGTATGTLSYIASGKSYVGAVTCSITRFGTSMGDVVEGSFATTTLGTTNGATPPTIPVSGSFKATRI